jgi:nucleotide-binding universal stress UspA family protein
MANLVENTNFTGSNNAPRSRARSLPQSAHALRRILVCIDRSSLSDVCVRHAVAMAKSLGGAITLLHVMQPTRERTGREATDVVDWEISRQEANAHLERLVKEGTESLGRPVELRLEQGHPAERIGAVARELDADLTILGSQRERDLAWNLGSTALQVLAAAHGSVLIARATDRDMASPKRILVPLDGSLRAESVLPAAVRIASAHGAELLLVFVVHEAAPTAVLCAAEDLEVARDLATRLEISGTRYLDGLRDQLVREGASARTVVLRSTDERRTLLELSLKEQSDLIVLSAHGSSCNPSLNTGSVTATLLTHSAVPLLVLQDLRDSEVRDPERERSAPPLRACYPGEV